MQAVPKPYCPSAPYPSLPIPFDSFPISPFPGFRSTSHACLPQMHCHLHVCVVMCSLCIFFICENIIATAPQSSSPNFPRDISYQSASPGMPISKRPWINCSFQYCDDASDRLRRLAFVLPPRPSCLCYRVIRRVAAPYVYSRRHSDYMKRRQTTVSQKGASKL